MKKPIQPLEELLDSVRDIEGFPIGTDEDILALSDPPYYTACPNPYINDFIEEYGTPYDEKTDDYHREPFVGDVSEGKNDPVYMAHTYHTKVPHKAIMHYIEHYTNPEDIVLDGFSGTGMTGIASQLLKRNIILSDLSPIATFIAYNYNVNRKALGFNEKNIKIIADIEKECGWMYETDHIDPKSKKAHLGEGKINYTIWSDVFSCPYCKKEYVFFDLAFDLETNKLKKNFTCPNCLAEITKNESNRVFDTYMDTLLNKKITQARQIPVLIHYIFQKKRFTKKPDQRDLAVINKINGTTIPYWVPVNRMPEGDESRRNDRIGITHVHHFYTKRNLWVLAAFAAKQGDSKDFINVTSVAATCCKMYRFRSQGGSLGAGGGPLSGTLYIPSLVKEIPTLKTIREHVAKWTRLHEKLHFGPNVRISTGSIESMPQIPNDSVDYIFTDPPFGQNLMYSELNYIWESWLKTFTNNKQEAIINRTQNKKLSEYHSLMHTAFIEYYRVLKPNRWITVEFHNSKSSIWNAIQDALIKSGFIIAQVTVLDKQQGSFKQVTAASATKNDLVISAYKPKQSFNKKFLEQAGENLEEEFIKMHLSHLKAEPTVERTEQMLYSKLLAYYVQRSYTVKYDSSTFYKMLRDNFTEEDSYWFNEDQLENYHEYKQKMKLEDIDEIKSGQMILFIQDEKSAIIWLNSFLNKPKDFQEIHPAYTKIANIAGDNVPDIKELLNKNFILEKGKYRRPQSEDEKLTVTEKRERELQREFDALLMEAKGSRRKIKECRKQAVIYGFEQCYKKNKFEDILTLASRLNKKIIENDSEITEFIEVAEMKEEGF